MDYQLLVLDMRSYRYINVCCNYLHRSYLLTGKIRRVLSPAGQRLLYKLGGL